MIIYLVFDNPNEYLLPLGHGIDITDFAAKHTSYELSVMLQAELDEFAILVYTFLKPKQKFPEWYEKQKSINRIYIDTRIRKGLCVLKPQAA